MPMLTRPSQLRFRNQNVEEYPLDYSILNINDLMTDAWVNSSDKIMVVITLYIKAASALDTQMTFYSRSERNAKMTYDKMIVGYDLFGSPGQNIVVFMLGKGQNENFFRDCIRLRDTGELGK